MAYTRTALEQALSDEDRPLAESLVATGQSEGGVDYMVMELQRYIIAHSSNGSLSDPASDIILDMLSPLMEASRTLEDANYIAPNLSPEVAALLLFISGDLLAETLQSGSPNWMMIPRGVWVAFVKLAKAAMDRHAQEQQ